MFLLDLSNEILCDILEFVEPVDLLNIYNVCQRLRDLAKWRINQVVLKLNLTGVNCFPIIKSQPFDNFDRIRVYKNWLDGKFTKKDLFAFHSYFSCTILVDEHFYVSELGAIRKYDRLWNGEYLSSEFKLIGNENHPPINSFAKKDDVIFAGCMNGNCMIFQNDEPAIERTKASQSGIYELDLFPKNNIYVNGDSDFIQIWKKEDRTLLPVERIPVCGACVKIDPSGEKLIAGSRHFNLYDFNTNTNEFLVGLETARNLLWKDNQIIISEHFNGSLQIYDLRTKSVCQNIDGLEDINNNILFDGQNAVLYSYYTKGVCIFDLRMNKILKEINIEPQDSIYQIHGDSKHLFLLYPDSFGLEVCDFSL